MKRKTQTKKQFTLDDLKPDLHNPNRGTERGRAMVAESLEQYGAGRSVLAARDGTLIAGNKTVEQARSSGAIKRVRTVHTTGDELVVVVRDDLEPHSKKARMLAVTDNRTGQVGLEWDVDVLAEIARRDGDLVGRLFEGERDILAAISPKTEADAGPQIDRAAELQKKWKTATGQLWRIGEHRLLCGDSTRREDVERAMQGERARLVIIDPPYGVAYADKNKFLNAISRANCVETPIENDHGTKEKTQAMWKAAFAEMSAIMSSGAVVYCFMPQGGDQMMMMMMMTGAGIEPRHEIIWLKNNHVLGRVDYAYKHEPILYAWKDGGHKFYGDFQTSILEFPKPQVSDLHPTMKPVALVERLVSNSSVGGQIVYDGFVGSGTTLVACQNLGRKCRAIEIAPQYVAVCLERMATAFPGIEIERIDDGKVKAHRRTKAKAA